MESTKFQIQEIITDGRQVAKPNLFAEISMHKGIMGDYLYNIQGHSCTRCKGVLGYVCRDAIKCLHVWFCADTECLKHDSGCSKSMDREKRFKEDGEKKHFQPFHFLPERYLNASFSKWDNDKVNADAVTRWLANPKDFLFYHGKQGEGKTFFSCACYNWLSNKYKAHEITWIDAKKLKNQVYKAIEHSNYFDILEKICRNKIVILDGLCEFTTSEWQKEVITTFLDMLYEKMIPTVITSSLSIQEIGQKISPKAAGKFNNSCLIIDQAAHNEEILHGKK